MSVNTAFETSDLPKAEFMFPGPERDRLVKLILDGVKTATAALMIEYEEEVEPLPCVGAHSVLVDSDERPVAVLVTTAVDVIPLGKVTDRYAIDEGEGDVTAAQWRSAHESFWNSAEYRDEFANPIFPLNLNVSIVFVSLCFQGFQRIAFCAYTLLTLYFLVSLQLYTRKRPARQAERLM